MTDEELLSCLEALLFASGKPVDSKTLMSIMDINNDKLTEIATKLENRYLTEEFGIQLIEINNGYQLATKEKFYDKVCTLLDNRPKPSLSQAAMEVLAIMAYNPKITRAEIEKIRGVSSDSAINKLLEYGLIEEAGRLDAPGRPMAFKTTDEFLRLFGYRSLQDMPELPKLAEEDPQLQIEGMDEENDDSPVESPNDENNDEVLPKNEEQIIDENDDKIEEN